MKEKKKKEEEVQKEQEEGEKEEKRNWEQNQGHQVQTGGGSDQSQGDLSSHQTPPPKGPAAEANRSRTGPLNSIYRKLWMPNISQNTDTACPSSSWWSPWVPSAEASH